MQWIKGEHYRQVKGSVFGPFHGREYQTLVPLHVEIPRMRWTHRVDHVVSGRVRIMKDNGHGCPKLIIAAGYKYDGPSGPTWDDRTNMRASCAHDALYALLRRRQLGAICSDNWHHNRRVADDLLGEMMVADGAYRWRARYYVWAVHTFGLLAAGG